MTKETPTENLGKLQCSTMLMLAEKTRQKVDRSAKKKLFHLQSVHTESQLKETINICEMVRKIYCEMDLIIVF